MRVMVTGGAGYIGSVVAYRLLEAGHDVLIYDNLSSGHSDAVDARAQFVHADIADAFALRDAFRRHRIEGVVHMAAFALVAESVRNPAKYYENNVVASINLLDCMRECEVRAIVFSSSGTVYGERSGERLTEEDTPNPMNPYGETKLAFERALGWYGDAFGLRHVSLRYFNAAGAVGALGERHDPETHLIPLVLQVAAGQRSQIDIYGADYPTPDGTCVRDYVHVTDLAAAHVLSLSALVNQTQSSVYNVGCGGRGYSIRDVIAVASEVTGKSIPCRVVERRPGDPSVLVADTSKIERELAWRPDHGDLFSIIESAWRFMRDASRA